MSYLYNIYIINQLPLRLPQLAAFADRHFFVKKEIRDKRTVTRVKVLEGDERIDEIARMLGGGKAAIEHAREMVKIGSPV